jgi:hypothetical protein
LNLIVTMIPRSSDITFLVLGTSTSTDIYTVLFMMVLLAFFFFPVLSVVHPHPGQNDEACGCKN